jgi:hypothetical protein
MKCLRVFLALSSGLRQLPQGLGGSLEHGRSRTSERARKTELRNGRQGERRRGDGLGDVLDLDGPDLVERFCFLLTVYVYGNQVER